MLRTAVAAAWVAWAAAACTKADVLRSNLAERSERHGGLDKKTQECSF